MTSYTVDIGPNLVQVLTLLIVSANALFNAYLHWRNSVEHAALKAEIKAANGSLHDH